MKISLLAVLFVISLVVILYPLIANRLSEKNASLIETQYTETIEKLYPTELEEVRDRAIRYNSGLLSVSATAFTKDAINSASEFYDEILNFRGDGLMGYVEIPVLSVKLPIYHGTDEETLDRGVGHLLGSSLPVGGASTHCVLTGHSGLAGQKMFSDLDLLTPGDIFFLRILNMTLAYKVVEINTVLPEESDKLLIEPGRDLCTLVTCTPFAVNTHRLLVCGERIDYEEAEAVVEDAEFTPLEESTWDEAYRRGLGCGLLAVCGIAAGAGVLRLCTGGGFSVHRDTTPSNNPFHRDTTPIRNPFHDETDFLARKRVWASRAVQTHFGISKPRLPERKRGKHEIH